MVLCAEWRQLQEWRRLAEDNPHGHEIIRLMQVRGDRERQPPADVGTACGNMTNLHVLLVMLTLMRVNPMVVMNERYSILRGTAPCLRRAQRPSSASNTEFVLAANPVAASGVAAL